MMFTVPAWAQDERDDETGEALYREHCAMCHGTDATGMMEMHPALRGAVDRLSREGVEVTVRNGRATTPPMPAFAHRLTAEEIDEVVAYVESLPDGPRNFGPGEGNMGDGMMDRMMDGGAALMFLVVVIIAAGLAGAVGYFVGTRRRG